MTSPVYVSDKMVVNVVPYAARRAVLRLDVGPFALLYFAVYFCIWQWDTKEGTGKIVALMVLPIVLVCHLLVFLCTQWSVRFNCLVSQRRVASIDGAESVRVVPAKHYGSSQLVPLHRRRDRGTTTADGNGAGHAGGGESTVAQGEESTPLVPSETSIEVAGRVFNTPDVWFVFNQTKFVLSNAGGKQGFLRLEYPSEGSFQAYLDCRGVKDESAMAAAEERWGPNVLDIPMPAFIDLFAEHAVAPFFVFQMLCVLLWSLDDYWYYALFTLVMLVLFEAMLCVQRQQSLKMLRSMRREPSLVHALRAGRWRVVSSEAVTPGEVVSLVARPPTMASAMRETKRLAEHRRAGRGRVSGRQEFGFPIGGSGRGKGGHMGMEVAHGIGGGGVAAGAGGDDEALAPFDLLLMRGSCVVNEAMLTGESVPQAKTSLAAAGDAGDDWVRLEDGTDSPHRKHVIFSGTKVLQHADGDDNDAGFPRGAEGASASGKAGGDGASDLSHLPPPPDKGCPCVVLRTGFETSQGQLMKTILFSTRRVAAGSDWETGVFILILLVFAAIASVFVLAEGLADETRNPFKLVLHCIMILTSVIPPELPIELSVAVMNSLTALTQSLIFCTEPFRIPLAGKVDVCCFDKTGTLTSDNLVMKGVAAAPMSGEGTINATSGKGDAIAGVGVKGATDPDVASAAALPATTAAPVHGLGEVPTRILAGCHSLVTLNGTLVGDSVEVATLKGLGWACLRGGLVVPRAAARAARADARAARNGTDAGGGVGSGSGGQDAALRPLQIVHSWPFDSSWRRMCTAVRLAPEVTGTSVNARAVPATRRDTEGGVHAGNADETSPFDGRLWIVAKGAPETMEEFLLDTPPNYRSTFLHHMGQGSRVLTLAYRALDPVVDVTTCRRMSRAMAEKGLKFGGFLVLACPLKPDAPYVVRELRESSHAVCMITGDGALTAADVARQVGMIDHRPARTLVLTLMNGGGRDISGGGQIANGTADLPGSTNAKAPNSVTAVATPEKCEGDGSRHLCWVTLSATDISNTGGDSSGSDAQNGVIPFLVGGVATLAERHALCVTGEVLSHVSGAGKEAVGNADSSCLDDKHPSKKSDERVMRPVSPAKGGRVPSRSPLSILCSHVTVFARVSPAQKELIVGELNAAGRTTLMCGDGTNDVGALRRAHVGVSIVNSPELEKRLGTFLDGDQQQQGEVDEGGASGGKKRKSQRVSEAKRSRVLAAREIEEQQLDPALVKLGDASIASPFTAKTTSVGCVLAVIRQGRCTLVTTLQVYKILALNCLTSAYMLSALYLRGVKQGDGQLTVLGLVISALFYCASRSHPLRRLSAVRPPARIFCAQACMSVLGQFAAHLAALLAVTRLCEEHVNPEDPSIMPDGPFRPNIFNSAVFLLSAVMQVNTFAVNYTGHPFMQSLGENRPMRNLVAVAYTALIAATAGVWPSFDAWMQLAPMPGSFRGPLLAILAADTALVYVIEAGTKWWSRRFEGGSANRGKLGRKDAAGKGKVKRAKRLQR